MDPLTTWAADRCKTIEELKKLANNMNYYAEKSTIVSASGTGTSILSSIGAMACYIAAPFTAGITTAPAIALTVVAFAGAATSVGATVTNYFFEKGYIRDVEEALKKDTTSFGVLIEKVKEANALTSNQDIELATTGIDVLANGIRLGAFVGRGFVVTERSLAGLIALGKTARFASHAVAVIAIPLDIAIFVKDVIDLVNGDVSAAAKEVLKLVEKLQTEYNEIMSDADKI